MQRKTLREKNRTHKTDIAKAVVSIMKPQLLFMLKLNAVRKIIRKKQKRREYFHDEFSGADYEARTRYLHLGKVALYQMS